jgi:hypothetical protein
MKAQFWRSYLIHHTPLRLETGSDVDGLLREFEHTEGQLLALRIVAQQYVTFVETHSMDLGQVAVMYRRFKELLSDGD